MSNQLGPGNLQSILESVQIQTTHALPATANYVAAGTAAAATTAILATYGNTAASYAVPSNGTVNVAVAVSAAVTLTMTRNAGVGSPSYNALNDNNALTASTEYAFSVPMRSGETLDFELSGAATINVFDVFFVPAQ